MGNNPRWVPPGRLIEVTQRTIHGRYLLRPSRDLNDIFTGVLIRAAERYEVRICAFVALSNHYHLLVVPKDGLALSRFMAYFAGNLAKEIGRLHRWGEKVFGRRYSHVPVSDEPAAQEARLTYLLSQGCKEGLIRRPEDWPGPSSTESLLTGRPVEGIWFDRSQEYECGRQRCRYGKYEFAMSHRLALSPLPAWEGISDAERRAKVRGMVKEITRETKRRNLEMGRVPLGPKKVSRQNPWAKAPDLARAIRPIVHATAREVRLTLKMQFHLFLRAYREASAALRAGQLTVDFPPGCQPPLLPFVNGRPPPSG